MIEILSGNPIATPIVAAAIRRSCGRDTVRILDRQRPSATAIVVIIDPAALPEKLVEHVISGGCRKVLLFGRLGGRLESYGLYDVPVDDELRRAAECKSALIHGSAESSAAVVYRKSVAGESIALPKRAFVRFDFRDEWNNLGFGAIRTDESIWSISCQARSVGWEELSAVEIDGRPVSIWSAMWQSDQCSMLWFNRPVGPVDSADWVHIETFLCAHRFGQIPCQPVIEQVPFGYDSAVTMRLDCDEDIESARALFQIYRTNAVPFSLAILASLLEDERNHILPRDVLASGGSLLSHSFSHDAKWGGCYERARAEALASAEKLSGLFSVDIQSAVSPFHQTPAYARQALADAGYHACVAGIIQNDPDFLMARAGYGPDDEGRIIGHSQQCMLHGDCMLAAGDPLRIYKEAYDIAKRSKTFFGYLDHPFSERYAYGWPNEESRLVAHADLILYMKSSGKILSANQSDSLAFLKACADVDCSEQERTFRLSRFKTAPWPISIAYGTHHLELREGLELPKYV